METFGGVVVIAAAVLLVGWLAGVITIKINIIR